MEVVEEGRGPKVLKSNSPKVSGSKGPRVLRTKISQTQFEYELDSKEGPSC